MPASLKRKRRILLIEDTVPLAKLYVEFLRGEPLDVVHVAKGRDALTFQQWRSTEESAA